MQNTHFFMASENAWLGTDRKLCLIRHCLGWQEQMCLDMIDCNEALFLLWMNELNQLFPLHHQLLRAYALAQLVPLVSQLSK